MIITGGMLQVFSRQKSGNIDKYHKRHWTITALTKNYLVQNVDNAKGEKSCTGGI